MKNNVVIICVFFIALALVSCISRKPSEPMVIENTKTITEVVKDTIYKIEADSSFYNAYVECVNGKPVLVSNEDRGYFQTNNKQEKLPKNKPGKYLGIPKVNLQNGLLTVNCETRAQELFKQWREKYITEKTKEISPPVYIEKPFKWYQKTLMWIGAISLVLIAIGIVLKIKK
ncbi:hypothetical protein GCM10022217_15830 [Chryseobacterium ginsenosidimutans]|uniref:hypothetical protein n=1 Tax=Chryseobacterium ginsenosidimutans TaxID=687846 RepID=UPI0031D6E2DE